MTAATDTDDAEPRYWIELSEPAEADRDDAVFRLIRQVGPAYADEWLAGLNERIQSLAVFPGPNAHPIVRTREEFGQEVRRLLYYGPRGRRSANRYRILFTVFPPATPQDETVIRILSIRHSAAGDGESDSE
jgi:plasmid stabilization system protein ParE